MAGFRKYAGYREEKFGVLLVDEDLNIRVIDSKYAKQLNSGRISGVLKEFLIQMGYVEGGKANHKEHMFLGDIELDSIEVDECVNTLSAPLGVEFEITQKCNLSCAHCATYNGCAGEREELDTMEVRDLFLQMRRMKVFFVTLTGGEPFLRPDIMGLLDYASEIGLRVNVLTNGLLIDENNVKKIPKNTGLQLSIDGLGSVYDSIRGAGNFARLERTMEILRDNSIPFAGCFVYTNMNKHNLDETMQYCLENNIRLKVNTLLPFGRAYENLGYLNPELEIDADLLYSARKKKIVAYKKMYAEKFPKGRPLNVYDYFEIFQSLFRACDAARSDLWITCSGEVYPCPNLAALGQLALGDLREERLKEIWNKKSTNTFREKYQWSAFKECASCHISEHCNQKCMALSYVLNNGEFTGCGCTDLLKLVISKAMQDGLSSAF